MKNIFNIIIYFLLFITKILILLYPVIFCYYIIKNYFDININIFNKILLPYPIILTLPFWFVPFSLIVKSISIKNDNLKENIKKNKLIILNGIIFVFVLAVNIFLFLLNIQFSWLLLLNVIILNNFFLFLNYYALKIKSH
jgi:hypothetical protein